MTENRSARRGPPPASPAIALFGGVFDPIHSGHVEIAKLALERLPIAEVLFLPAGNPPHKQDRQPAAGTHRLAMIECAIAGESQFRVDPRELERTGPSYTILTLLELASERPGTTIYFLIGADNARTIGSWHRAKEIFAACDPVVIARPGESVTFTEDDVPFLAKEDRARLNGHVIEGVALEQSSSEVRHRLARGDSLDGWVPRAVAEYIAKHDLYRQV